MPNKYISNMNISFDNKESIFFRWYEELDTTIDGVDRIALVGDIFGLSFRDINKIIDIKLINTFDTELNLYNADIKKRSDEQIKTELDLRLFDLQKEYLNYQVNLGRKLKTNKVSSDIFGGLTNFQDKFLEIVDNLFSETNKKVNRDKNELEFLLGDKEINAYQLSSGEKQLLVILLTVLVQDNKPSILLMDEPEISLHIEWQRKLIKYIRELNPNAQVIVATHSPDIIIKGWLDKVVNIEDIIVKDNAVA